MVNSIRDGTPCLKGEYTMKASEGKLGRVFFIRLEDGDDAADTLRRFAVENGIHAGQVFLLASQSVTGIIAPDAEGNPGLRIPGGLGGYAGCDVVVQELLGFNFQRITDPASGQETLARVASTKTRVMEKPAPIPEEQGPGTVPVYLFNAEFN